MFRQLKKIVGRGELSYVDGVDLTQFINSPSLLELIDFKLFQAHRSL